MATTYEPIATTTASGSVSSITFSSISGTYTDLVIVANGSNGNADNSYLIRFNSDTGANYSYTGLDGNGSSATSFRDSNTSEGAAGTIGTSNTTTIINVFNYSNTTTYKTWVARGNNASARTRAFVGMWRNTSAITSVTLTNNAASNFTNTTTFTLYGIKAA